MGYDETSDTFIFSLKDALGNETIGLDGGGNATIEGVDAGDITNTVTNFDGRNDRISVTPANPTIASDGSAVDHTVNTDGSCNISLEWGFSGTGDAYDIDGFKLYVRTSSSSSSYTMGTAVAEEQQYIVDKDKRALILEGVAIDKYYTFGVRAYRAVDDDIDADGVLQSSIIQPSLAAENPYRPASSVAFDGDVTGTIDGTSATTVKDYASNSVQKDTAYNTVKITSADGVVATRSDDKARTTLAGGELLIEKGDGTGTTWKDMFYIDSDGNAIFAGEVFIGDGPYLRIYSSGIALPQIQFRTDSGTSYIPEGLISYSSSGGYSGGGSLSFSTQNYSSLQSEDLSFDSTDSIVFSANTDFSIGCSDLKINTDTGYSGTLSFGGGSTGDVATMTFTNGILTGITEVP
jgi:hypothetical protein